MKQITFASPHRRVIIAVVPSQNGGRVVVKVYYTKIRPLVKNMCVCVQMCVFVCTYVMSSIVRGRAQNPPRTNVGGGSIVRKIYKTGIH